MNLFALLLGLAIERLLTQLFHLREFHWLDPVFDAAFARARQWNQAACIVTAVGVAVLLTLPVMLVSLLLGGAWFNLLYFPFAVFVLLFSLGPRDLKEEVDEYLAAVTSGDPDRIQRLARELAEMDVPGEDPVQRDRLVERAVFVQANNRIFGVVFWFLVLGPAGAWMFRVLDLMRRRAAIGSGDSGPDSLQSAIQTLHGIVAWIPARLLAASYALAGSFEEAIADWRGYYQNCAMRFFDINNDVLGCAGMGATGRASSQCELEPGAPVRAAMDLVVRALWLIWCPAIAVLTLYELVA